MSSTSLSIHLQKKEVPKVIVEKFSDFYILRIGADTQPHPQIKFFFYSLQQVTNFKNNLLWAFEKPIKITE